MPKPEGTNGANGAERQGAAPRTRRAVDERAAYPTTPGTTIDKGEFLASIMEDPARHRYYLAIARRIVGPQEAEDMVQDAFVRALSSSAELTTQKNPNGWFARVVTTAALDYGRKITRRGESSLDLMAEDGALDTLEQLSDTPNLGRGIEAGETSRRVQQAIESANLSEIKQLLLQGRYGESEKGYEALAAECNERGFTKPDGSEVDANYVKSLLNRGREEVKKQLKAVGIDSLEAATGEEAQS